MVLCTDFRRLKSVGRLHTAELDAVVAAEAVVTVQLLVADAHVGAGHAVAQLHAAHAALEAVQVVEQAQALDDHGRTAACEYINI